jgi:hypothetical protein
MKSLLYKIWTTFRGFWLIVCYCDICLFMSSWEYPLFVINYILKKATGFDIDRIPTVQFLRYNVV